MDKNYAVFKLIGEGTWEQETHWLDLEAAQSHSKLEYLKDYHLQIFMRVSIPHNPTL